MTAPVIPRQTKYSSAIKRALVRMGHATNAELLEWLRGTYPDLSATTVHRASARLAARHKIGVAPPALNGAIRYDANPLPHDHFYCQGCGMLRDAAIRDDMVRLLERAIGGDCQVSGNLTISGTCNWCTVNES